MASISDTHYTDAECAEYLRRTTRTLNRWRKKSYGPPFVKIGVEYRYSKASVAKWLASLEQQGGAQ